MHLSAAQTSSSFKCLDAHTYIHVNHTHLQNWSAQFILLNYYCFRWLLQQSNDLYCTYSVFTTCMDTSLWCDVVVWIPLGVPLSLPTSPSYTPQTVEWISIGEIFWNAKTFKPGACQPASSTCLVSYNCFYLWIPVCVCVSPPRGY